MNNIIKLFPFTKMVPQDYEEWLEKLEERGWHLYKTTFGGLVHHFKKDKPHKIKYCLDYQVKKKSDYEQIFEDIGWELVYYFQGTYLWRIKYKDGNKPNAFTDIDSIKKRNNRLLACSLAVLLISLSSDILLVDNIVFKPHLFLNLLNTYMETPSLFFMGLLRLCTRIGLPIYFFTLFILANYKIDRYIKCV